MPRPHEPTDPRVSSRTVLKDEPDTLVEQLVALAANGGSDTIVVKTYRVHGLRWLQSWWRKSRAQREHDHLATIVRAGVPCLQPLGWSAVKRVPFGFRSSTLQTRFLADSTPLKQVLRTLGRSGGDARIRGRLAAAMGTLVADLHQAGVLWCTPMPRNVLVQGAPVQARLAVCDTPACIRTDRSLHGSRLCRIDLFLGAFSPSRRRDWSRTERLRWLLGYTRGERAAARALWRTMARRSSLQNELERAFAMVVWTYVRDWLRLLRPTPASRH